MLDCNLKDFRPMIIDSFAGGGGASTGIELALGRSPDVAINHNAAALALHAANHPETLHLDSNIWDVEPRSVTKGRPVGLLWASPDCKHFSKAKGGAPRDRNIRDLAWVVVRWAEDVKPDVIVMENVEEFRTWGPIGEDGQPIKELSGVTFELWMKRLRRAGYRLQWRELRACDYGAPTIRKRFFMIARRDGRPIVWPKPTHGDPATTAVKRGKLLPWHTAAECIDWSLPCPSIFDTSEEIKEKHGLRSIRPLAANTLARVARGMRRYVLDAERPFLVNLTHGGRLEDAYEPFRTITGAHRGEKALVAPSIEVWCFHPRKNTRLLCGATGQDLRVPLATVTANSWIKKPGGAVPLGLISPALATFYGHSDGRGVRSATLLDPLRTVTTENRHALVAPLLATMRNSQKPWQGANEPTHTITAGGAGLTVIAPNLMSMKGTARRDSAVDAPHPTVLAGGGQSAILAPVITYAQHGGAVRSVADPHHTVTASKKDQNCLLTAFLAQQNSQRSGFHPGRAVDAPLSTVTQTGSQQSLVAPWFAKYYGTGDGARTDVPCHTVTVKDRMGHIQATIDAPPFTEAHAERAREVADFMRSFGDWDDREFVTLEIEGTTFVIVDIGMRMLTPRELFRAQGFPPDYVIEGVWRDVAGEWVWHPFPKDVQISCCGNSVCPPIAQAIVGANCAHLIDARIEATA